MTVEFNRLVGVDSVTTSFGSRNFIISFPGQTEVVDKVTYNVEAGELQLVITPKLGTAGIDHRLLKFTSAGIQADLVFIIGADSLSELGSIYSDIKDFLASAKVISLTHTQPTEKFANIQIFDPTYSCLSELVTHLHSELALKLSADSASNLLFSLETLTNSYKSSLVGATTFEAAAALFRAGAHRHEIFVDTNLPAGSIPSASNAQGFGTDSQPQNPSPDWYEPKVYRGTNLS
jgi:nicotinic acid mononucleotide adenylyltransferase